MSKGALQPCEPSVAPACCPPAVTPMGLNGINNAFETGFGEKAFVLINTPGPHVLEMSVANLDTATPGLEIEFDLISGPAPLGAAPTVSGSLVTLVPGGISNLQVTLDSTGGNTADIWALLIRNECGCCESINLVFPVA